MKTPIIFPATIIMEELYFAMEKLITMEQVIMEQPIITMEVEVGKQPDLAWYGTLEKHDFTLIRGSR